MPKGNCGANLLQHLLNVLKGDGFIGGALFRWVSKAKDGTEAFMNRMMGMDEVLTEITRHYTAMMHIQRLKLAGISPDV